MSAHAKAVGYRREHRGYIHQKISGDEEGPSRFSFAHVLAWEEHFGRKKPKGHVIVILDGNKHNLDPINLYCLPKSELLGWMRFIRCPVEVHVDKLWRQVMALNTSKSVQQKLLDVLERVLDEDTPLNIMRQRAACETVHTIIALHRLEVSYFELLEEKPVIPFLEEARKEIAAEKNCSEEEARAVVGTLRASRMAWLGKSRRNLIRAALMRRKH